MKQGFFNMICIMLLAGSLISCKDNNSKNAQTPGGSTIIDPTSPSDLNLNIESVSPIDDATNVALDTKISATFNRAIDPGLLDIQSFVLVDRLGRTIDGGASCSGTTVTFAPSEELSLGVTYSAIVKNLKDETGISLSSPYGWDFTSRDGAWSALDYIDVWAYDARVAIDPEGNGIAIWSGQGPGESLSRMMSSTYHEDTGWGDPVCIQGDNSGFVSYPCLAMDQNGNALAVWTMGTHLQYMHLYCNRFVPGEGWGSPVLLETVEDQNVLFPAITANRQGQAVVAWSQYDGEDYSVWATTCDSGVWDNPVRMDNGLSNAIWPEAAINENGRAIVIWAEKESVAVFTTRVWANIFIPGQGWGGPEKLPGDGLGMESPGVAMDSSGNAIIVGTDWDSSPVAAKAVWYSPAEGFGTPFVLEITSAATGFTDVAMDPYGNALVVWLKWDGAAPPYHVWARRYSPDSGWGTETLVDGGAGTAGEPQAVMDSNGNGMILWDREADEVHSLMMVRSPLSGAYGSPAAIDQGNADDYATRRFNDIDVNASGKALVIWDIFSSFGNSGNVLDGSSFR